MILLRHYTQETSRIRLQYHNIYIYILYRDFEVYCYFTIN